MQFTDFLYKRNNIFFKSTKLSKQKISQNIKKRENQENFLTSIKIFPLKSQFPKNLYSKLISHLHTKSILHNITGNTIHCDSLVDCQNIINFRAKVSKKLGIYTEIQCETRINIPKYNATFMLSQCESFEFLQIPNTRGLAYFDSSTANTSIQTFQLFYNTVRFWEVEQTQHFILLQFFEKNFTFSINFH